MGEFLYVGYTSADILKHCRYELLEYILIMVQYNGFIYENCRQINLPFTVQFCNVHFASLQLLYSFTHMIWLKGKLRKDVYNIRYHTFIHVEWQVCYFTYCISFEWFLPSDKMVVGGATTDIKIHSYHQTCVCQSYLMTPRLYFVTPVNMGGTVC